MKNKVIFLDIDGVVTSLRTGWYNLDVYCINFLIWVCKKADVKIVISSAWRYSHGNDFWLSVFGECLHEDFRTPRSIREQVFADKDATRGNEIQLWLNRHPEIEKYLILDDDGDMLESQMASFIQTDSLDGMLSKHMIAIKDYFELDEFYHFDKIFVCNNMFGEYNRLSNREDKNK